MEYKVDTKCCDKVNDIDKGSQFLDANGNQVNVKIHSDNSDQAECNCVGVQIDNQIKTTMGESHSSQQIDESLMKKLQKITLSDDDYGEWIRVK